MTISEKCAKSPPCPCGKGTWWCEAPPSKHDGKPHTHVAFPKHPPSGPDAPHLTYGHYRVEWDDNGNWIYDPHFVRPENKIEQAVWGD